MNSHARPDSLEHPAVTLLMRSPRFIAQTLSEAFLAGSLETEGLVLRGAQVLGKRWRWLRPLARRVIDHFAPGPRPRRISLTRFLLQDEGFRKHWHKIEPASLNAASISPQMQPASAATDWGVPQLRTPSELAAWLGTTNRKLDWFADLCDLHIKCQNQSLQHYRYRLAAKVDGRLRLLEAPKSLLKMMQRQILDELLAQVPPHSAAHGFCPGRSIKTFAQPHVGCRVVLRIDLLEFFPSIHAPRIRGLFQTIGYPEVIADQLAGLCTSATPYDIWETAPATTDRRLLNHQRQLYAARHLPQGAPTSPALANLCAFRLDCRLAGLAAAAGATYTRYADDLAFSGNEAFERGVQRFRLHACAIAMEEGFAVHHRKTRIMRQGVRQHLAGIVVNERLNVRRDDFDRLKATLTNCVRHGPASQNHGQHEDFRGHLLGRIAFVTMIHPGRGKKLKTIFDQIVW